MCSMLCKAKSMGDISAHHSHSTASTSVHLEVLVRRQRRRRLDCTILEAGRLRLCFIAGGGTVPAADRVIAELTIEVTHGLRPIIVTDAYAALYANALRLERSAAVKRVLAIRHRMRTVCII